MAIRRRSSFDGTFGVSLTVSTVIHLALFSLLIWNKGIFEPLTPVQEAYYVDVVNLPVASPQAGSPSSKGIGIKSPSPKSPPQKSAKPKMSLPSPKSQMNLPSPKKPMPQPASNKHMTLPGPTKHIQPNYPPKIEAGSVRRPITKPADSGKPEDESAAFEDNLAKLQGRAEARNEESAIENLRRKVASGGNGRAGMPNANGSEAGSRYEDYIKSRLEDALRKTSSYSSSNPFVYIRLTIAVNGQLTQKRIEKSSGDHTFEMAVMRAINLFGETPYPPPDHRTFEHDFLFKPRKITRTRS